MTESADTSAESATDSQTPDAATDGTGPAPEPGSGDTSAENDAPEPNPTNSEAARYRVERNQARTERDALAQRLAAYQRRECEAAVADLLDVPGDLFDIGGAELAGFYTEDGSVNEAELRAAAGALLEQRPRLAKQQTGHQRRSWGQHSAAPPVEDNSGWQRVLGG